MTSLPSAFPANLGMANQLFQLHLRPAIMQSLMVSFAEVANCVSFFPHSAEGILYFFIWRRVHFLIGFHRINVCSCETPPTEKFTGSEKRLKRSSWIMFCLQKTVQCKNQIKFANVCADRWSSHGVWKCVQHDFQEKRAHPSYRATSTSLPMLLGAKFASTPARLFWRHFKATCEEIKHVLPYTISNSHHANIPLLFVFAQPKASEYTSRFVHVAHELKDICMTANICYWSWSTKE